MRGDEFLLLLPDVTDVDAVVTVARRMGRELEAAPIPLDAEQTEIEVRADIGVSVFPDRGSRLEDLIRTADRATYRAKEI